MDLDSYLDYLRGVIRSTSDKGAYPLKSNQFRLSSIGKCARQLYFEKLYPDKKTEKSLESLGTLLAGTHIHERFEKWSEQYAYQHQSYPNLCISESKGKCTVTKVEGLIEVIGHYDLVIDDAIVDLKSTSSKSAFYIKKQGPQRAYIKQANAYAYLLGLKEWALVYIIKDTYEIFGWKAPVSKELYSDNIERLSNIYNCTLTKVPPEPDAEEWECGYCGYSEECLKFGRLVAQKQNEVKEK